MKKRKARRRFSEGPRRRLMRSPRRRPAFSCQFARVRDRWPPVTSHSPSLRGKYKYEKTQSNGYIGAPRLKHGHLTALWPRGNRHQPSSVVSPVRRDPENHSESAITAIAKGWCEQDQGALEWHPMSTCLLVREVSSASEETKTLGDFFVCVA